MKLPEEDEVRRSIRSALHPELQLAGRLLGFAVSVFATNRAVHPGDGIDEFVTTAALGLLAKMCKQYRGIIALVELGLGEDAQNLTRIHFESMLAMQFILRRRVSLKKGKRPLPPVSGMPLTSGFRARLYLANAFFNHRKVVNCVRQTAGMKRCFSVATKREVDAEAQAWEAEIGPEWTERLKARGYSGLSVEDLAYSLGYQGLYNTLYRLASPGVHAQDGMSFTELVETGAAGLADNRAFVEFMVGPSMDKVSTVLKLASLFIIHAVDVADKRFGFGMGGGVVRFVDEINLMGADSG